MNSKLMSQEEQITEYNERIAAMEEELKKVSIFQIHSTSAFLCNTSPAQLPLFVKVMSCHDTVSGVSDEFCACVGRLWTCSQTVSKNWTSALRTCRTRARDWRRLTRT